MFLMDIGGTKWKRLRWLSLNLNGFKRRDGCPNFANVVALFTNYRIIFLAYFKSSKLLFGTAKVNYKQKRYSSS